MRRTIAGLLAIGMLSACSAEKSATTTTTVAQRPETTTTTTPEETTTTEAANQCLTVHPEVLGSLGLEAAGGFGPDGETGLGKDAYFVATAGGAVWLTSEDPSSGNLGLTLPLNDGARTASEIGVDASPDAPAYGDITADSDGALQALACAQG